MVGRIPYRTLDNDELIEEIVTIKDHAPDEMTPTLYDIRSDITRHLYGTVSLHDAFARKYPQFCLRTVLWMINHGPIEQLPNSGKGAMYSSDGVMGGTIHIHPRRANLSRCLADAAWDANGLYLYFDDHSNIVWLDPETKSIHRYDPQVSHHADETQSIDSALADFFAQALPDYTYYGNTLEPEQCIQEVRLRHRGTLDCFCQEYTLLYALRRINGMSHTQAAEDIITHLEDIPLLLREFYHDLLVR